MASRFVRRLVPAMAVALAVAFVGFGVVGIASADPASAGTGAPGTFRLAERHGGDRGSFDWSVDVVHADGVVQTTASGTQDFHWLDEAAWFDGATGTWHAAHPRLVLDRQYADADFEEEFLAWSWTETSSRRPLGSSWNAQFEYRWGGSGPGPLTFGTKATALHEHTEWEVGEPCGLAEALRAGVTFGTVLEVQDPCLAQDEGGPGPLRFTMQDAELDGIPTVRFEADSGDAHISIDYHQAIPEPLRELRTWPGEYGQVHQSVRRLVSFEAGTSPWDTGLQDRLPASVHLPAIELAPRQPWGPDESGVEHPFPASQAWQSARDDPDFPDLRDFLAAHPDASARRTEYEETVEGSTTTRSWTFFVVDGSDTLLLRSRQEQGPAAGSHTDFLGLPSAPVPLTTTDATAFSSSMRCDNDPAAELPTVASVLARWRAHAESSGGAGNAWGLDCGYEGDLVSAGATLAVSDALRAQDFVEGTGRNGTTASSLLQVWQDGRPRGLSTDNMHHQEATAVGPRAAPIVDPGPARPSSQRPPLVLASAWVVPDTPVASGAAAASLAAGILYWLWPAVKGGSIGLFSRIEGSRLLDHPLRRSIVDVVEAQPGIHYQAILRTVGGGKGAVAHHLDKLCAGGVLVRHKGPGYTCYFPARTDRRVAAVAGPLKAAGARDVLTAVRARPGASSAQVAAATGLDASTVSHHVHRLAEAGLVRMTRMGRALRIEPTPLAGALD